MNVLIVYAHEEPLSFNGALRDTAIRVLTEEGHRVEVSDLYAMGFNPVGGRHDFTSLHDPTHFQYRVEQAHATQSGTFSADVAAEQKKLLEADFLLFQFPMWWFGLPAILKGWVDRVFASGLTHGGDRWYSNGVFRGKRAMLSLTTGGPPSIYTPRGLNGSLETLLYPVQHGMLYLVGFEVLPPFVAYSAGLSGPEERDEYLSQFTERLRTWRTTPPLEFHPLDHYDASFQLKAEFDPEAAELGSLPHEPEGQPA